LASSTFEDGLTRSSQQRRDQSRSVPQSYEREREQQDDFDRGTSSTRILRHLEGVLEEETIGSGGYRGKCLGICSCIVEGIAEGRRRRRSCIGFEKRRRYLASLRLEASVRARERSSSSSSFIPSY